jgi:hypothetical protein
MECARLGSRALGKRPPALREAGSPEENAALRTVCIQEILPVACPVCRLPLSIHSSTR